jgi:hypothetical protein
MMMTFREILDIWNSIGVEAEEWGGSFGFNSFPDPPKGGSGETDGWISINPPGQPSAADQVKSIELDARECKLDQRELALDARELKIKQREQEVASKEYLVLQKLNEVEKRERELGLLDDMAKNVLGD